MARLIHINGIPGLGKTSLASALAERLPLALLVDIDAIRTNLGQWKVRPESRLEARELAIGLIESQLGRGHDVVLPQFVGRVAFIEQLDQVAGDAGARFVEVMLAGDTSVAEQRFRQRRSELDGESHPESDVADHEIAATIAEAATALAAVAEARTRTIHVDARGDFAPTLSLLIEAIEIA